MDVISQKVSKSKKKTLLIVVRNIGYLRLLLDFMVSKCTEYNYVVFTLKPSTSEELNKSRYFIENSLIGTGINIRFFQSTSQIEIPRRVKIYIMMADVLFFAQPLLRSFKAPRIRVMKTYGLSSHLVWTLARIFQFLHFENRLDNLRRSLISIVTRYIVTTRHKEFDYVLRFVDPDLVLILGVTASLESRFFASSCSYMKSPYISLLASWDNLTTKGQLFLLPSERLLTWSNFQIEESKNLHMFDDVNARAVGAYPFHNLMNLTKSSRSVKGENQAIEVLWLCSSGFIAKNNDRQLRENWQFAELDMIISFLEHLQRYKSHKKVILRVRVHPSVSIKIKNRHLLREHLLSYQSDYLKIVIELPQDSVTQKSRKDYWKSIEKCDVFISLATSAALEASLLGKSGLMPPGNLAMRSLQDMPHGGYLLKSKRGPLLVTQSFDDLVKRILDGRLSSKIFSNSKILGTKNQILNSFDLLSEEINRNLKFSPLEGMKKLKLDKRSLHFWGRLLALSVYLLDLITAKPDQLFRYILRRF